MNFQTKMRFWMIITMSIFALLGSSTNILACVILTKNPNIMGQAQGMVINQSIIDAVLAISLLVSRSFVVDAIGIHIDYKDNWLSYVLCKIWHPDSFLIGFISASTYNLVFLTIERFARIVHPFWSRRYLTDRVMVIFRVIPWVFGIGNKLITYWFTFTTDVTANGCVYLSEEVNKVIHMSGIVIDFLIPLMIFIVCYYKILKTVSKQRKTMKKYEENSSETSGTKVTSVSEEVSSDGISTIKVSNPVANDTDNKNVSARREQNQIQPKRNLAHKIERTDVKIIKVFLVVSVTFVLCYVPLITSIPIVQVLGEEYADHMMAIINVFAMMNCTVNPFIYVIMHAKIRSVLWNKLAFWK